MRYMKTDLWVRTDLTVFSEVSTHSKHLATILRFSLTTGAVNNNEDRILRFVDRAPLYNLFQMKPTRCALLLSIFISTSLHVSGNCVSIIRRTYCIYATLVFFHYLWAVIWSADQTATQPVLFTFYILGVLKLKN